MLHSIPVLLQDAYKCLSMTKTTYSTLTLHMYVYVYTVLGRISHAIMCKRLIIACPRCKTLDKNLFPCKEYDKIKYPNMFSSGWMYEHLRRSENNVKNSIKFKFCSKCQHRNMVWTQPQCDQYYRLNIKLLIDLIRTTHKGTVDVRNVFNHGYIFLD